MSLWKIQPRGRRLSTSTMSTAWVRRSYMVRAQAPIVVPIIIPIAAAANVDPFVPALAATFAASFGFMLPVSTPQNAIVYGSGVVPITQMVRNGSVFDLLGGLLILAGIPLMVGVLGIGG